MDVKERLAALKRKRMAAKTANHRDVVEEDRVAKLPANFEAKKERAQYELGEIERKKEIEASGDFFTQFSVWIIWWKVATTSVRKCWTKRRSIWREKTRNANERRIRIPASSLGKIIPPDSITGSHEVNQIYRITSVFIVTRLGNKTIVSENYSFTRF